jgi:hypothetical protein
MMAPILDEGSADSTDIAPPDPSSLLSAAPVSALPDLAPVGSVSQVAVPPRAAPVTVPSAGAPQPEILPSAEPIADQPIADLPIATDPVWEKQPNLAPHRRRVEQFRKILAQQAG